MPANPTSETNPPEMNQCTIGILGIQGAFLEHKAALLQASRLLERPLNLDIFDLRTAADITDALEGIIIPGGESTVISMFLKRNQMEEKLKLWTKKEHHVTWGTCAGMILLAEKSEHQKDGGQPQIGGLDVVVSRNFFGRQIQSFEAEVELNDKLMVRESGGTPGELKNTFHGVFIRAPGVVQVNNESVKILATLNCPQQGPLTVAVQQNNLIATAFHPELTEDPTWHLYFLKTILSLRKGKKISTLQTDG